MDLAMIGTSLRTRRRLWWTISFRRSRRQRGARLLHPARMMPMPSEARRMAL